MYELKICIIILSFFIACSSVDKLPDEAKAKDDLQEYLFENTPMTEGIVITDFNRKNALTRNVDGNEYYVVEYTCTVTYNYEGWYSFDNPKQPPFKREVLEHNPTDFDVINVFDGYELHRMDNEYRFLQPGAKVSLSGIINYELTENGWRPNLFEFDNYRVISNPVDLELRFNKGHYDRFIGQWIPDNRRARIDYFEIFKDDGDFYVTFDRDKQGRRKLFLSDRKLGFYDMDMPAYFTYWIARDRIIYSEFGTYRKVR